MLVATMIRYVTFAALLCLAGAAPVCAQPAQPNAEDAAILAVIDRFMDAISNNDAVLMAELRVDGGSTIVSRPNPAAADGPLVTRRVFDAKAPARTGTSTSRERYWDPVVHVRGGIAVVWTPYE